VIYVKNKNFAKVCIHCKSSIRDDLCFLQGSSKNEKEAAIRYSDGCGQRQPIYRRSGLELTIEWKDTLDENIERKAKLPAARVLEIFKLIPDTICRILGMDPRYSRPDWMILTVLPVPPICVRPSVLLFGTARSQDDLTYNLADIIRANNTLREDERRGVTAHIVDEHLQYLQHCCASLIDNDIPGMPQLRQKNGRPLKTLKARLKGLIFIFL
jgi:DNA-directed RNA polymerase II subunit RPB1